MLTAAATAAQGAPTFFIIVCLGGVVVGGALYLLGLLR